MDSRDNRATRMLAAYRAGYRGLIVFSTLVWCSLQGGCAAISNPIANGVPVRRLPPELLGESKEGTESVPLSLLRQPPPASYKLGAGDILGVWVEGILGEKGQAPPVRVPESGNGLPSIGYPTPVRDDGTISLPLIPPLRVTGMTLNEVQEAIRKAYTVDGQILVKGQERISVSLVRPRLYHILVIRQDSGGDAGGAAGASGGSGGTGLRAASRSAGIVLSVGGGGKGTRKGTGFALDLPAYENDVLNALAQTGGVPGTDAADAIVIERGAYLGAAGREGVLKAFQGQGITPLPGGGQRIRIPLRVRRGNMPTIRPEEITLQTGDIVFVESREPDVFYTAGMLPAGEYTLPRDADLDVVEAITRIGGSLVTGGLSTVNISGTLIVPGFGNPSPSLVTVVRKTPGGGQLAIRVDMDKALRDPRERLLIQPRDVIILQELPEQALARYLSGAFKLNAVYDFIMSSRFTSTATGTVP